MPDLTIIAGCNGAGKSTFASSFLPDGMSSFDYDKLFLENYRAIPDSELRDQFARHKTISYFENAVENALKSQSDFCYETNFDSLPTYWAERFKQEGFNLNLIFFCLDNQQIARHRIEVRTEFDGHFVDAVTIDLKWKAGYDNLNTYFNYFDNILIVDNSISNEIYTNILEIRNGVLTIINDTIPAYIEERLPNIFELIKRKLKN